MTSNHNLPLREKSITAVHNYKLRPLKDISKNKRFHHAKPLTNTKKWSTSVPVTNKKIRKKSPNINSSMDVTDLIRDADLTIFTDLEHDAFQLAKYVESNANIDEMLNETQKTNPCGIRTEDRSMSNTSLDDLLDISINELQEATNPSISKGVNGYETRSGDATDQSDQSRKPKVNPFKRLPNMLSTKPLTFDGTRSGGTNHSDQSSKPTRNPFKEQPNALLLTFDGTSSGEATNHSDQSRKPTGNPFKRQQNAASTKPITFGDRAQRISVHKPAGSSAHKTTVTERVFPTSVASRSNSNDAIHHAPYTAWTKNFALKQKVTNLFNRPCYNYLNGRCSGTVCKWNHGLPPARDVYHKLMQLSDETVQYIYFNFVLRHNTAFDTYFPSMCEVFGKRKMKSILVGAIGDCGKREKIPFLKFVFNGLIFNGLSKRDALTMVANNCCKNKECYDVLLEIIIETDALYFVDMLKEYHLYGTINAESMVKLLQQVVDAPGTALLAVFIDILDKYSMYGGFDAETFESFIPRVKKLVMGDLSLAQQVSHIVNRMQ